MRDCDFKWGAGGGGAPAGRAVAAKSPQCASSRPVGCWAGGSGCGRFGPREGPGRGSPEGRVGHEGFLSPTWSRWERGAARAVIVMQGKGGRQGPLSAGAKEAAIHTGCMGTLQALHLFVSGPPATHRVLIDPAAVPRPCPEPYPRPAPSLCLPFLLQACKQASVLQCSRFRLRDGPPSGTGVVGGGGSGASGGVACLPAASHAGRTSGAHAACPLWNPGPHQPTDAALFPRGW